jgi:hypothetical protein
MELSEQPLAVKNARALCGLHVWSPISTIMRWLTSQCSCTTTLGHIGPEHFLQQEAVQTIPWPAMSPDMTLARPSVGRNKKRLSSDQWTRLHVRIVHPKWSCDQSNRAWRWRNTIPWPAMSPDMNPIEHVWDFIGRKINQRNPKCQNIDELRTAIQRMIVEMRDYAWSEHIVTVFLTCQITIKNVQIQLTVKRKTTPDSYTPIPKAVVPKMWLSWNEGLTSQCSWTTTLGHIEPELYNIFYSKSLFRQFHGLRCRQTWSL